MDFCSLKIDFSVKFSPFSLTKSQKVVGKNIFNYCFYQILGFSKVIYFKLPQIKLDNECATG